MPKVRFAPEGWLFIIPVMILTAAALLLQWWTAAIVFGLLDAFLFNFFRDPHRVGSERHVDVLSPADGTVVQIKDIDDHDIWPASIKNIPANTEFPFEWIDHVDGFSRYTVNVIDVKTWN